MFKLTRALSVNAVVITCYLVLLTAPQQAWAQSTSDFDPTDLCPLIANGTKIKDQRYCNVYITCMNDTSISGSCGDQFYDRNTGECVDPTTITCLSSDPCAKRPTGFVDDPYSCNYYYYCANGVGTRGQCSTGLNYNPETNNCVRNFSCEITMLPEDYCNIVPEGVFIGVPGSCTEYQVCWQSQLLNGTCPDGFYFDAYRGGCDYPSHVDCAQHNSNVPEDIPADVECTEAGVFISDGVSCDGYFYCGALVDGEFDMRHGRCPVDRFFDPTDGGQCVARTSIKCDHDRCVTLGMDFIQMANVNDDGCRGFSLCQNGKTIGNAVCPEGEYFDELAQLCVNRVVNYVACAADAASASADDDGAGTTTQMVYGQAATTLNPNADFVSLVSVLKPKVLSAVPVPRLL
ncbi:peritrophin-44-like [Musca autumnalis]|uniref:peritrophin-44-like n=1 Tax=Musca autumnalis TaxID=221902 RepID=UPI003CF63E13